MRAMSRCVVLVGAVLLSGSSAFCGDVEELIGTWTWTWTDAQEMKHTHFLEVEGTEGKIAARERMDDQPPVKVDDLRLDGKKVTFSVLRGERRAAYNGELKPTERIDGIVTVSQNEQNNEYGWAATRVPKKDASPRSYLLPR